MSRTHRNIPHWVITYLTKYPDKNDLREGLFYGYDGKPRNLLASSLRGYSEVGGSRKSRRFWKRQWHRYWRHHAQWWKDFD